MAVRETAAGALGDWSHARSQASGAAIQRLLDAGRFAEAVAIAEGVVTEGLAAGEQAYPKAPYDLALAHLVLGRALQESGAASASLEPLQEARHRFQALADASNRAAAVMVAAALAEVGDSLRGLGRLDEAARAYQQSIQRAEQTEDPRGSAVGRGQLGSVRLLQGEY
ncbi:MAG TPA: tetratricopeptide repeat protein, partial [Thermoanaerobaculia bacterium]|nr:tetratricopeptide repeat protein [Thermoanaerobaculia bacterium]